MKCGCGDSCQNAAHLMKCTEVGDGKGRTMEEGREDPEALVDFLAKNNTVIV